MVHGISTMDHTPDRFNPRFVLYTISQGYFYRFFICTKEFRLIQEI